MVLAIACAACIFSFAMTVKLLISYLELNARSSRDNLKSSAISSEESCVVDMKKHGKKEKRKKKNSREKRTSPGIPMVCDEKADEIKARKSSLFSLELAANLLCVISL
jgi:hypothetical protein